MPVTIQPRWALLGLLMSLNLVEASPAAAPQSTQLMPPSGIPRPAVIAHRGASFDAPESTAPAYRLARELGADYLELDLQRSKDGVLFALHDDNLQRTTDVASKFPERKDSPAHAFTLAELKTLDAGSWFNQAYPERARPAFHGLQILTLDEIIDIAQGSNTHQPGLYIETKSPHLFPGIEQDLKAQLLARGWLSPALPQQAKGTLAVGQGPGRVVLQSFDKRSLALLHQAMPHVPKVLLLWVGKGSIEPKSPQSFAESGLSDKAAFYASQQPRDQAELIRWLDAAKDGGAIGVGPSVAWAAGGEQSYADLVQPWMNQLAHERGLLVHAYTVDEPVDVRRVLAAGVDGIFTNRPTAMLDILQRPSPRSTTSILEEHGY